MELLLGIVIFGLMGAFTVFGYLRSEQSARDRARTRGDIGE